MAESRDFIPIGNCVEQDVALFANTLPGPTDLDVSQSELAKAACASCLQLPHCEQQRVAIGALLYQRGDDRPVVGGEIVPAEAVQGYDLSGVAQFGEVTLSFERTPLPKDGGRALRSIQQQFRSASTRVVGLSQVQHSTMDIAEWVRGMLQVHDPELLQQLAEDVRGAVVKEVGQHVLLHAAKRNPSGGFKKQGLRFAGFTPEDYYPFVRAFVTEAIANAGLGLPDPARRTTYHSADFHRAYLEAGRQEQLPVTSLHEGLTKQPTDPMRSARKHRDNAAKAKARHVQRLREQRRLAQSGLSRPVQEVFAGYDQDIVENIAKYFDYGVICVEDSENPTIQVGERFGDFHTIERQAILYAIGLKQFVPDLYDVEVMQYVLQAHDIKEFVFSTLLPQIDPLVALAEQNVTDIRSEPLLLMAVIRRALWTNETKVREVSDQPAVVDKLLAELSSEDSEYWAEQRKHVLQLHDVARRLLKKRSSELDDASFAALFGVYTFECQQLTAAGIPGAIVPRLALTTSAAAYKRQVKYAQLNGRITTEDVKYACLRRPASPLQAIRVLEKNMGALETSQAVAPFQPNEIKYLFSKRSMTAAEIRSLAATTTRLIKAFEDRLTPAEVRRICTSYEDDAEHLKAVLTTKWETIEALISKYGDRGNSIQRRRVRHVIFRAPLGTEEEALRTYFGQR